MSTPVTSLDRETAAALGRRKNEPDWLVEWRAEAGDLAGRLELPKPEKMPLARWKLDVYGDYRPGRPVADPSELPAALTELLSDANAEALLVQHNSGVVLARLPEELKAKGVTLTSLEEAARSHARLFRDHFMVAYRRDEHKLAALHAALWNGGAFLHVPKGVEIENPVQIVVFADDPAATVAPHILVIAEANSRVTVVEHMYSALPEGADALLVNGAVEIFAKAGSHVRYASVHHMESAAVDIAYRRAVLGADARVEWIVGDLHGGNLLSDLHSELEGQGSVTDIKVITVGTGSQRISLTTRVRHVGKASESNMITRAVMLDEATSILTGITKIEKGATKANGEQTERVLMLSPKARGDANPILLIDEDDVKAGHAASVGRVNEEQVYYLMSRGISRREAERLIIHGFLEPTVAEIPLEGLRETLRRILERKLG
ncbi:MAG TPA: Fe-S cluster assembly protein SufD [Paenibacillaceae bacterium]